MRRILTILAAAAMLTACGGGDNLGKDNKFTIKDGENTTSIKITYGGYADIPRGTMTAPQKLGGWLPAPAFAPATRAETNIYGTMLMMTNFDVKLINGEQSKFPADAMYVMLEVPTAMFGHTIDIAQPNEDLDWDGSISFYNGGDSYGYDLRSCTGGTISVSRNGEKFTVEFKNLVTNGKTIDFKHSGKFVDMLALPPSNGKGNITFNGAAKAIQWGGFKLDEYEWGSSYTIALSPEKGNYFTIGDIEGVVGFNFDAADLGKTLVLENGEFYFNYISETDYNFTLGTLKVTRTAGTDKFSIQFSVSCAEATVSGSWEGTLGDLSTIVPIFI